MRIETDNILFDLDGTLVNTVPGIEYACRVAIEAVLRNRTIPDLRRYIGPPIRQVLSQVLPDADAETLDQLERRFRLCYDGDGWQKSFAYDGVIETLKQLATRGIRCFVVTNKPCLPTQKILQHLGMINYLAATLSANSKTPPFTSKAEMASYLIAHHDLEAAKTVLVGDSDDDANAALKCGLMFIAVSYGYGRAYTRRDQTVSVVLDRFDQLLEIVSPPAL
jgi:phosphoglycolate phosphatase